MTLPGETLVRRNLKKKDFAFSSSPCLERDLVIKHCSSPYLEKEVISLVIDIIDCRAMESFRARYETFCVF